ncbi:hypothetical protein Mapa_013527 [Marchantia paleacea]|nr:hypothetical protein Mapa_013527 [Marchantia paleacea]
MAPAALLCPSGTVQSLCQTTASSSKVWQAKRSVSSGSAFSRASAESQIEGASVKSSLPASVYESRRRIGVRHVVRSGSSRRVFTAAVEGSVAVEEPSTEAEVVETSESTTPEAVAEPEQDSAPAAAPQRKGGKFRSRGNSRSKREDATVPVEALVPGAVFTGKVTTIQPFGAFVNFGAFTDGLVHISKLSSGYVSNVGDIVSLGQEVQVTVIDVDNTAGRIALSMAEKEERTEGSGRQGGEVGGDKSRFQEGNGGRPVNKGKSAGRGNQSNRREEPKKPQTKLVKGQVVEGTVKNTARGGVYVILPEEEEAFLKYSEVPGGENMAPESGLQAGQKITATVLRIDRGKITLSMKPVVDIKSVNNSINKGAGGGATNPFEIAFRAMDLIPEPGVEPAVDETVEEAPAAKTEESTTAAVADVAEEKTEDVEAVQTTETVEQAARVVDHPTPAPPAAEMIEETKPEEVPAEVTAEVAAPDTVEEKVEEVIENPAAEAAAIPAPVEENAEEVKEAPAVEASTPAPVEEMGEEVPETVEEKVEEVIETPAAEAAITETVEEKADEVAEIPAVEVSAPAPAEEEAEEATDTPAVEAASPAPVEEQAEELQAPKQVVPAAAAAVEEKKGGISAALVKRLRDETGAGMMDCKKALSESQGDFDSARDALRKKGLASADKKASRIASEGLVGSYIHDSRIGVLVEVNCETDFVARGPAFKQLVADLGMQVVACPQVKYVSVEDIPAEVVNKEMELEMQREDLANKPEAVRAKIVEGRVSKRMNENVLLEQPYIRDDSILVKDLVKQTVATLGENIKVRRFERYTLGEGLDKKSEDFAAEVAAQTAQKVEARKPEEKPAEANSVEEAAPKVAVSAGAVKELRDSTGAGMMDCKKALAATGNDLEKAVEFLRKKGLASADKKASRLASEGLVGSYVHNGIIGVLVEINCETDFVARSEKFKELVKDVAMQIAACPLVTAVSVEDVPASFVEAERAIELGKEDLANKPEAVRARIVEGRLNKRLCELALLEQPFIKDDTKLIKDVVKETVAALGENIQVRRFTRFNLGEGIEKKVVDFAAEVAAQTGQTS